MKYIDFFCRAHWRDFATKTAFFFGKCAHKDASPILF